MGCPDSSLLLGTPAVNLLPANIQKLCGERHLRSRCQTGRVDTQGSGPAAARSEHAAAPAWTRWADWAQGVCLERTGAWLDWPFDPHTPVVKVRGRPQGPARMFALISAHRLNLKCDPELAVQLRGAHAFVEPGWHMSKRHWNTVRLDLLVQLDPAEREEALVLVRQMVEDSWDLVVEGMPRADRERLRLAEAFTAPAE